MFLFTITVKKVIFSILQLKITKTLKFKCIKFNILNLITLA